VLHVWDDTPDDGAERTVFVRAHALRPPYPRASPEMEVDAEHVEVPARELKKLAEVFRQTIERTGEITGHGGISRDALDNAPPITVSGEAVDWPRRQR